MPNRIPTVISVVFWNIDDARYRLNNQRHCKLDNQQVIDYLTNHSIICLAETHCNSRDSIDLDGYNLMSNIRPKNPKATKFSGGLAVYVKTNIKKGVTFMPITSSEFMWVKLDKTFFNLQTDLYILLVYICPKNSSFSKKSEEIFGLIENEIALYCSKGIYLACGDDFNAHTNT